MKKTGQLRRAISLKTTHHDTACRENLEPQLNEASHHSREDRWPPLGSLERVRPSPVGPRSTTMIHPLRSMGITPLRRYYEAVAPLRRIGTFSLTAGAACAFPLASPARFSRSVRQPDRASRCLHTPDAARSVSGHP